jgi:GntR family transcriptional regulator
MPQPNPVLQPDLRLPLYQRLRDEIAHKIARNVWRSGEPIPTEAELAATHRVAIGTVRKAIDALVADGLVERQQGRGTFVRRPRFDRSLFRFFRHLESDGTQAVRSCPRRSGCRPCGSRLCSKRP